MDTVRLATAIGQKRWREGLARTPMPGVQLDFTEVSPIHRAFAPMARELRFDVCEMAIVTALQALAYGKALLLLPVTIAARFQHGCLIASADRPFTTAELRGRRVGVRAYTQTTGVWVRGILENDYGVPAADVAWVTQEGAHLAEYADPAWVTRAAPGRSLVDLLRAGEVAAAILGNDLPDDPDLRPVIAEPGAAAEAWHAQHGIVPINHMLVVRRDVAEANPEAIRTLWQALHAARPVSSGTDFANIGIAPNRAALEVLLGYCDQQRLLPRPLTVDAIFADTLRILGDAMSA